MALVHRTAIVDSRADVADDVQVGPFAVIQGRVSIGQGTIIGEHTIIHGQTRIGSNCRLGPGAFIGLDPQHIKYDGAPTRLIIGDGAIIRELASVHRAFAEGPEHATILGNHCFIMNNAHIGHDCRIGDNVTISSGALIGGHVQIGDHTFMGGASALHQFVRVGRLVIFAGQEGSSRDVPPFAAVRYAGLKAYNAVGCRRAGIGFESIKAIREAYFHIHHHRNLADAVAAIRETVAPVPEVHELLDFIATTKRGIHPSIHFRRALADADD
jgi:UDP-N-acetylglucosamine acyltransferase